MEEKLIQCINSHKQQVIHNKDIPNTDFFHCQMSSNIIADKDVYIDCVPN